MRRGSVGLQAVLRRIHLYVAVVFGVLFSLLGLSGSWLVFYPEIDSQLLGFDTRLPDTGTISWQRVLQAADRAIGASKDLSVIVRPFGDTGPVLVMSQFGEQALSLDYGEAYIDPFGAKVLAARQIFSKDQSWRENLSGIAFALHSGLFLGTVGHVMIVIVGLFLLGSALTGLWIWWPRGRWRAAVFLITTRPGSRAFLGELHRVSGLYASLLLGVMVVTGVYFGLEPLVTEAVSAVLPVTPEPDIPVPAQGSGFAAADLDAAVAAAVALYPEREVRTIVSMRGDHPGYEILLAPDDDSTRSVGATKVFLDATGAVVGVRDPSIETRGDTLLRWLMPLHMGTAFGTAGRAIVCVIGLLPLAFFVTGITLWARRRSRLG